MDNQEIELMPKWLPPIQRETSFGLILTKWLLIALLGLFTLGVITSLDHTTNGAKGNH
jgi:hypothetical protein